MLAGVSLLLAGMLLPGSAVSWLHGGDHLLGRLLRGVDPASIWISRWFHVLMFAWLVVCLCGLFPRLRGWQVAAILLGLGVVGELAQIPVPGRTAGVGDLMDDVLGIAVGLATVVAARRYRKARQQRRNIA